jgi:hypothetical protein
MNCKNCGDKIIKDENSLFQRKEFCSFSCEREYLINKLR